MDVSMMLGVFQNKTRLSQNRSEVTVGCLGVVSTHYNSFGAFPDHFGPKSEKRPKNNNNNNDNC